MGCALPRPAHFFFLPPAGYFLSRKAGEFRAPARDASGGILSFLGERKYPKNAIQGGRKFRSSFPLENPPSLSDQRGRAAALPLWKHPPGVWAIIKSRLCREAAKVGGGLWPPVGVKGRTDSHASDVGHWLGMTPLRGVLADGHKGCGGQMAGGIPQGHSFRFAPQRRTPPLHTKYRTAQLCISEQKRQRKEKQRQCNI